jgi:hypothetical protein
MRWISTWRKHRGSGSRGAGGWTVVEEKSVGRGRCVRAVDPEEGWRRVG